MTQTNLITPIDICQRKVCLDNICALFTEKEAGMYDIILEINSNKFLIAMENIENQVNSLEIVATKGFIELNNTIILMIKKIVEHLRYRLD